MSRQSPLLDSLIICATERAVPITHALFHTNAADNLASPIDDFYSYRSSLVVLGTPDALTNNEALGKVLLLGMVSATEYFFRALLAGVLHLCPISRKRAFTEQLPFGALDYYHSSEMGFALLEGHSFSSKGEISAQSRRLVGFEWNQSSSLGTAMDEFDKLCQFRHASVHARGDIGAKNLQNIGGTVSLGRQAVKIDVAALQECIALCQNVVRAYNGALYREVVNRWLNGTVLTGQWRSDRIKFSNLHNLFRSSSDFGTLSAKETYDLLGPSLQSAIAGRVGRM